MGVYHVDLFYRIYMRIAEIFAYLCYNCSYFLFHVAMPRIKKILLQR